MYTHVIVHRSPPPSLSPVTANKHSFPVHFAPHTSNLRILRSSPLYPLLTTPTNHLNTPSNFIIVKAKKDDSSGSDVQENGSSKAKLEKSSGSVVTPKQKNHLISFLRALLVALLTPVYEELFVEEVKRFFDFVAKKKVWITVSSWIPSFAKKMFLDFVGNRVVREVSWMLFIFGLVCIALTLDEMENR